MSKNKTNSNNIATNRKAFYEYDILDKYGESRWSFSGGWNYWYYFCTFYNFT